MVVATSVLCAEAPLIVVAVWKNGPVSAASMSGGTLNVEWSEPLAYQPLAACLLKHD